MPVQSRLTARHRAAAVGATPFASHFPRSGWVEQDANTIWEVQLLAASEAVEQCGGWRQIFAIGITNQRETTVVWDRATGEPIGPAIVWQCRRTSSICAELALRATDRLFLSAPGWCWTLTSPAPRSAGFWITCPTQDAGPRTASWHSGPSILG